MPREVLDFVDDDVLDALRRSGKPRVWSSLAAELLDIDRPQVKMPAVRGIRNACRRLEREGLVEEVPGRGSWASYGSWPTSLRFRAI